MKDTDPLRIVVLASGRGSNLQALLDAAAVGTIRAHIVGVLSDRSDAPALRRAEAQGVPTVSLDPLSYPERADYDHALFARVASFDPDLVVLAGFMRVLDAAVVHAWEGRMINIHPSLLPKYPGLRTHQRAIAAGDGAHGASVHFVSAEVDGGPVIAQARIAVVQDDTPQSLAARLLPREHALLVAVCGLIAERRLGWTSGSVQLDGSTLSRALQLDESDHLT